MKEKVENNSIDVITLDDLNMTQKTSQKLKDYGIESLKDIICYTKKDFLKKVNSDYGLLKSIYQKLELLGLDFKEKENGQSLNFLKKSVADMDDKEINMLYSEKIENIGFTKTLTKELKKQDEIENFGDLLMLSPIEIFEIVKGDNYLYTKVYERFAELGLDIPKYKEVSKFKRLINKNIIDQDTFDRYDNVVLYEDKNLYDSDNNDEDIDEKV